ncbi:MAG: integrase/recombinase, partial [Thermoplasmatales archaeon I-plasma]
KEELARILRKATSRGRVAIAIMAFSGLRPESLGDYEGTDGLRLGDLKELKLSDEIQFDKIPATVMVKSKLSKARHQYFSFIGEEGTTYIREYLEERRKNGEELTYESPLLQFDVRGVKKNAFLRTTLVTRDIREAMEQAGLRMRPYVLRAYFSTALDIAESKGLISHPWRQFIMGHKGDIEARYSTNKRLPPDIIDEMRESYNKSTKFLETRISEVSEENARLYLQQQLLSAVGYRQDEIDKMNLAETSTEDFQKLLRDKVAGAMTSNGSKQKLVPMNEIEKLLGEGYEFQVVLPKRKGYNENAVLTSKLEIPKELPKNEIWANYFVEGFRSIFYYTLPDIWDARVIGILNIFNLLGITPIQAKLIDKLQEEFGKDRKFYWNHINGLAKKWRMLNVEYDIHKNKKVYFVNREFILHDDLLTKEKISELFSMWVKVANLYYGTDESRRLKTVFFCGRCKFKNVLKDMNKAEFLFFARNFMETSEYYCLNCGTYYGFFRRKLDANEYKDWKGFPFAYGKRRKDAVP